MIILIESQWNLNYHDLLYLLSTLFILIESQWNLNELREFVKTVENVY